jgi:hypothetical protein
MMAEHHWSSATVITMTPHIARTRVLMDRCVTSGEVTVIGNADHLRIRDWVYQFFYQTGGFIKVALMPGC